MPGDGPNQQDNEQATIDDVYNRMDVLCNQTAVVPMTTAWKITPMAAGGPDASDWISDWTTRFRKLQSSSQSWSLGMMHTWQEQMWLMFNDKIRYEASNIAAFRWLRTALHPSRRLPFRMLNRFWYWAQLTLPGRVAVFTGPKDAGKTDNAMKAAEDLIALKIDHKARGKESELAGIMAYLLGGRGGGGIDLQRYKKSRLSLFYAKDIRVVTNIDVKRGHPYSDYFQFASSLSDIYIEINQNALDGYFSHGVFDEMGKAMPVVRTTSSGTMAIMDWLREIRKPNASISLVTQDLRRDFGARVGTDERIGIRTFVTKLNARSAIYQVDGVPALQWQKVTGIPGTNLPFETRDPASFRSDLNPKVLADAVDIFRRVARDEGYEWKLEDTFKMTIDVARRIRSMELVPVKPGHDDPKNSIVVLLGSTPKPGSSRPFTPKEIERYTGEPISVIEEKLKTAASNSVRKAAEA